MTRASPAERITVWTVCVLLSLVAWAAVCVAIWRAVEIIGGGIN